MGGEMMVIIDVMSLGMGLMLIIAPNKAYNMGKKEHEKKEIPPKTKIGFTIFGIVVVIAASLFLYFDLFAG